MLPAVTDSPETLIALISTVGAVLVAGFGVLGILLSKTHSHAKAAEISSAAARDQVQNSHKTNFRDDTDANHAQLLRILQGHTASISGIQRDVGRLADADLEHTKQSRLDRDRLTRHIDQTPT